ncbi:bifunctional UDP-N-acetylglucosamine diphosphorylase/glucosamine-1-phosphate N-acetyltransferase GlmU [Clostridium oryzae]|uniref:Bifunctional protein GlmU n=1 Tax=Clostridium oryzae TaxID=1450648 RepID=A0A1V4IME5_9CLOT|nr:bifunctional UDP-N-acetylglucosamine diphosphorylase/glucosamine-1-phosphate N-acetyltransferase GlmU [Clostridium oryzae]OPJ61086.1 bifunctional protein GlmU [Clostridium oryzae]
MYNCALILAAGEGKRMKSNTPKVLHKVCGKEMVNHVIDTLKSAGIEDINVIVGKSAEQVKEKTGDRNASYSLQDAQLGTAHAVKCALEFLKDKKGTVLIFTGDAPLITKDTVEKLVSYKDEEDYSGVIVTSIIENPFGYGRILRDRDGVKGIIEHKDCNKDELLINEINAGMYAFDIEDLVENIGKISNDNVQKEYYLTDIIKIFVKQNKKVGSLPVPFEETLGVNSPLELSKVEAIMRNRINTMHMINGVKIIDPVSTYIDVDVKIDSNTIIYPGNVLQGNTEIKEGTILYPNSRIENSIIGENVTVQCSVILDSTIGKNSTVGPYAYIRPQSVIGERTRIGDFVEIKKSVIGNGTKVSHLTYIGDAEVGQNCNFGCGTVVVNYDGKKKCKTIIGNNAFIGCNTNLVSPVEVKDNTYIAAGSTITEEVPEESLAIARARQVNIKGWVSKRKTK